MKKGFTLIELLAVILILGIIALIAIPTVNNILEEARMGAFKTSVSQVAKSAEENCQLQQIKNEELTNKITFTDGTPSINLEYKGTGPDKGQMNVTNDCGVTFAVADTRYCAIRENVADEIKVGKLENDVCIIDGDEYELESKEYTPEECFVFDEENGAIIEYLCGMRYNNTTYVFEQGAKYYPDVVVPKTINGVEVKHIAEKAFSTWYVGQSNGYTSDYIYSKINSIEFPNTLISIGAYAFADNNVSYFNLPSSLQYIGSDAFYNKIALSFELGHLANEFTSENYPGLQIALESCSYNAANKWTVKYKSLDDKYEKFILDSNTFVEGEENIMQSTYNVQKFSNYQLYSLYHKGIEC